jgi:hypothetical protein
MMQNIFALRPLSRGLLALLAFTMVLTLGCGMAGGLVESITGGGGGGNRELWSDVPKMDGLDRADEGLPLTARLAIQAMFPGDIDYLAFSTPQTPADVQAFYTVERMNSAGWEDDGMGCVGEGSAEIAGATGVGAVCFFTKQEGDKSWALAIVAAPHEGTNNTDVFFVRVNIAELVTPTPGN